MAFNKVSLNQKGQSIVELSLVFPLLIVLVLGAIEVSNIIDINLTLTHLTREGANLTSRGGPLLEADIQASLDAIIAAAAPTITNGNSAEWYIIYSQIVYNPGAGACGTNLSSGDPDYYHIVRAGTWTKGSFTQASKVGNDGDCADQAAALATTIKGMAPDQAFHVVEAFFNYTPSTLTPVENFLGDFLPNLFYDRTIFTQV